MGRSSESLRLGLRIQHNCKMSGVFWEPEKQPNLCEAASGFTLSTVNLAVAIPMAVVDILVAATIFLSSTLVTLLSPVVEYLLSGLVMLMEMVGLEKPSADQTLLGVVALSTVFAIYKQFSGKTGAKERMFGALMMHAEAWIFLFTFLSVPALDKAVFANVILLALALQLAKNSITYLFTGFHDMNEQRKPNEMDGFASGMKKALDLESCIALLIAAFGYPSFAETDQTTAYLCLIPFIALHLVFEAEILPNVCAEDQPDSPNGEAVAVAESQPVEETVLEDLKPAEGAEKVSDEVLPEPAAEDATAPAAAGDGSSVETIPGDKKTEALIARLKGCVCGLYGWVAGKVLFLISPVCQLLAKIISTITSLPWSCISLFTLTNMSTLLWAWTWYQLTSNNLALLLPVSSLLVPPALEKLTILPATWRPVVSQLNLLAYNVVQCLVITGGSQVQEE